MSFEFFIGPCVLESEELCAEIIEFLQDFFSTYPEINWYFKGSFDKANRTSFSSYRGSGLEKGLEIFSAVIQKYKIKTITDIHLPEQAIPVAKVVDILQIPAFLCRQTDLLLAASKACANENRILNIKKAQFLAPWDMKNVLEKVLSILPLEQIRITERGTCFGYNTLITDFSGIEILKSFGAKVIYDATHSLQKPGGLGTQTGGQREAFFPMTAAAIASGVEGIFMEVHPDPSKALSDASTSISLTDVKKFLPKLLSLQHFTKTLYDELL